MMTKEDFKQTLIRQYTDVIEEMIIESESNCRSHINYQELDLRVRTLLKAAKIDGLEESVVCSILERKVPDYFKKSTLSLKAA